MVRLDSQAYIIDNIRLIAPWATAVAAGPPDEAQQLLDFAVTENTNPSLFDVLPSVDSSGNLIFSPKPNVSGVATITLQLHDSGGTVSGGVDTSPPQIFSINISKPHPWHNAASRLDVTGRPDGSPDGHVVAEDALAIINYINAFTAGAVPASATIGQPFGFLDATGGDNGAGDNFIAPNDALEVINAINAGLGGEGEGFVADVSPMASGTNNPQAPAAKHDEWTDLLSLLALDTAQQGSTRRNLRR
jgi:hypothetical protein